MEFKGTKGIASLSIPFDGTILIDGNVKATVLPYSDLKGLQIEDKANAILFSKAPEMLSEINETLTDLKILKYQILDASKTNHLFEGMPELIETWIERKEQLIKEATTL